MGRKPILSAGRKILKAAKAAHHRQPQSLGDMVLTDRGLITEIAQFVLGDLTCKVHIFYSTYSSTIVNVLWDTGVIVQRIYHLCVVQENFTH